MQNVLILYRYNLNILIYMCVCVYGVKLCDMQEKIVGYRFLDG